MATLHLQNSVKQHTAYKTPSLTDNKINSAPKNVMLKKGGDQGLWWGLWLSLPLPDWEFWKYSHKMLAPGGTFEETWKHLKINWHWSTSSCCGLKLA